MSQQPDTGNDIKPPISFDNVPAIELESMRLQLNKLISSLKNLQQQLVLPSVANSNTPTISWTKLSERVEAAINHLHKLQKNIIQFDNYNIYPNIKKFPVNEEELINVLLRKKNLPEIDKLYADLLHIGQETIADFKISKDLSQLEDEDIIKRYFSQNDQSIFKNLKLLKQTKKELFGNKESDEKDSMKDDDKIDPKTFTITSASIPFDIEEVYKFMYTGSKKQQDVVML